MMKNQLCCADCGSDDFFGPLCVVSCYVNSQDESWLNDLHIKDIDLDDLQQVIQTGKILKDKLIYSLLLLDNSHYNQMVEDGLKMSQIKVKLYNQALINVMQKVNQPIETKVIHWFLSPKKYYKNLRHKTLVVSHLVFAKNDDNYMGLKCAKILSKYAYFQYFRNMNTALNIELPHGHNKIANLAGVDLVYLYGKDILSRVAKTNMPNYKQILEQIK